MKIGPPPLGDLADDKPGTLGVLALQVFDIFNQVCTRYVKHVKRSIEGKCAVLWFIGF